MKLSNESVFPRILNATKGITRKEFATILAMHGILSGGWYLPPKEMAEKSLEYVNCLITALEKEND